MLPSMFFEDMGLTYIGPIDGHNINSMIDALQTANKANKAVVIHTITKKGKGYSPAEKYPSRFHGTPPFIIDNGKPLRNNTRPSYTKVFSNALIKNAKNNDKVVAITAAIYGTGLMAFKALSPQVF